MTKADLPILLSGRASQGLAESVAKQLKTKLAHVRLSTFENSEIFCKIEQSVRGHHVFVLQSHTANVNDNLMEQLLMIDAAKRASAKSITAVCPFLGYARQDRKSSGRESIAAKMVIDMLKTAGADRIITIDLHSGQAQGFFDGPFDHLIAMPILIEYIANLKIKNLVVVSPDAGRVKLTERYAGQLNCDMAIIHKHRSTIKHHSVEARYLIGDVKGKNCVMIDDMIDTAGTICAAADLLAKNGASSVIGLVTHGIFSGPAIQRINDSSFSKVVVTDTLPQTLSLNSKKIEVLSVAKLLADAIYAVANNNSVSELFNGLNQS